MSRRLVMGICVSVLVLLSSSLALAQTSTARISGLVTDASGAVLPGVQVVVSNVATGEARSMTSNERGRYVAAELAPGPYDVMATLEGFDTLVRSGITLAVGDDASINLIMQVGSITQQVTVTGEAPLVNTTSSGVSGVVEERRITDLPLNGRDFGRLAVVQPGALNVRTAAGGDASKGYGTRLSLTGSRPMDTGYSLDGTNVNSVGNFATPGSAGGGVLGVDAIREFRVVTGGGYSAEYGAYSGGVVQMVTKAGTNQFHGTAFGLHRNDNFDANTWENNRAGEDKAEFRRNQFGGTLGGPIMSDRAFFFGAYEGLRQARVGETSTGTVPDQNIHKGILPDGRQVAIAPNIKPYLDLWPLGNGGPAEEPGTEFRYTPEDTLTNENYFVVRGDYHINDSQKIFARLTYDNSDETNPGGLGVFNEVIASRQRFSTIQYENVLTPTLLSSSSLAFNRTPLNEVIEFIINIPESLYYMHHPSPPSLSYGGVSSFGGTNPNTRVQNKWELAQSFSYSKGDHTLKFGGSYSHVIFNNSGPAAGAYGSINWDDAEDFLTDANLSSLTVEVPGADTHRTVLQDIYGMYFQDDWRMRPNFTLNLGLRYEPWTSPGEKWDRVSTYRDWVTATEFSAPSTDGTDVYFDSPGESTFSPRVGLAWDVNGDGKTAIRAGAGIFHVMIGSPYLNTVTRKNPPDAGTLIANNPGVNFANSPAYVIERTPGIRSTTLTPSTFSEAIQYDMDPMYELKFNFTVEREITPDLSVSVGYAGNRGTHLTMKSDWNAAPATLVNGRPFVAAGTPRVNPNNGVITGTTTDAKLFYNALTVEVKKRLSQGFQLQTVYTWSKTVDDATTGLGNSDFGEGLVTQPYNHKADRGLGATHLGQNLVINGLWSLPSPTGSRFASYVLGGWQLSGILSASSGVPFGVTVRGASGSAVAPDRRRSIQEQHPDLVAGRSFDSLTSGTTAGCTFAGSATVGFTPGPYDASKPAANSVAPGQELGTPDLYFDPCGFSVPAAGFYGNAGRNIMIGPGFLNLDFSLTKSMPIGINEESRLQFHADFFNIANHPNFGRPEDAVLEKNGRVRGGGGRIDSATAERQIQFGLKLIF